MSAAVHLVAILDAEADPGRLQTLDQLLAHGNCGSELPGAFGQLVVSEAQRGLAEHLGRLAVARIAPRDLCQHPAPAALAHEADAKPGALALLGRGPLPGRFDLEQRLAPG